ncbi:tail fiber assembly protein [Salmonella enterica subsp. salamae]|uniref:Phage tail protein n=2 Tax=Salmonella enterica TaxID=28901 RepID=A0A6C7C331_SALER|nr:phage tail protein [Salmonella enterica subsp. salamae serovar 55:k:z39 str. 1315K]ECC1479305.1 tail fiber assembly protein [Salmonella enterica subsp. salamae]EEL7717256.1 tail fiber assembly protein [Salmonella enterica]ECC1656490.1 tail fiber assembly protein [Salmonella enterica subsp. salamae]ECD9413318.1 tail fiber assembly protein [Salmonella enterica subsp. salamae]
MGGGRILIMSTYKFSAHKNAFYPITQQAIYEQAGTWPADVVDVDDSVYQEFAANISPVGKMRAVGDDGLPMWIDIPEPDPQLQAIRKTVPQLSLAAFALQCAVDEGKASETQIAELAVLRADIANRIGEKT